jgi:hypothetical protein
MPGPLPDIIARYFDPTIERDTDTMLALFAADATVVDEGQTHRGIDAIRAWRTGPATAYDYATEIFSAEAVDANHYVVTGRITGNFPGATADLNWHFTLGDKRIERLVIAP